jgi:hypothetical protein
MSVLGRDHFPRHGCERKMRVWARENYELVPKPRVNLTRYHGVFAPNSSYRARVTPARRDRGSQHTARTDREAAPTPAERRAATTWEQRLKRVFGIDIEACAACGGALRIIACIEDPEVIEKIRSQVVRLHARLAAKFDGESPPMAGLAHFGVPRDRADITPAAGGRSARGAGVRYRSPAGGRYG